MTTSTKIKLSEKILPAFHEFWRDSDKYLYKVLKGGRNSAKSTQIALRIIYDMMKKPINTLAVRKVAATLETSVFEQLMWAIDHLGVTEYWSAKKNPLELTYIPQGNRIIFRGADQPQKIKSIKTHQFPIANLWIEELSEFKNEDEVDVIVNSLLRDQLPEGLEYSIFYSYNPPKRKQNWVNKKYETQFIADNTLVHHTTYKDNPFVSSTFLEEIEQVKEWDERKYRWIFLGEPIGGGVVPFDNLTFRKITDEEVKSFDNIRQGIDWGYAADPFCFLRLHYDKRRRKLYLLDEIYKVKMSNREAAQEIKQRGYDDFPVIADSEEPKSIAEMKDYGLKIKGAKKGPGSVEYGEKWLEDLTEIIIDYNRTPNTAWEFENIDYQMDKDGNIKNRLEDKDNHSIDTTRYALEGDMNRSGISFLK